MHAAIHVLNSLCGNASKMQQCNRKKRNGVGRRQFKCKGCV